MFSKPPPNRFSPLRQLSREPWIITTAHLLPQNAHLPPPPRSCSGLLPTCSRGRCTWHLDSIVGLSQAWYGFSWNFFLGESDLTIFKSQECPFRASGPGACSGHLIATTAFAGHAPFMEAALRTPRAAMHRDECTAGCVGVRA